MSTALPCGAPDAPAGAQAPRRVFLQTYGCQMNVLDSQLVREELRALGYVFVENGDEADIVLLNTCSVRALSEQKVWSALGRLGVRRQRTGRPLVGVLGCMAERESVRLQQRPEQLDIVCGPSELAQLPQLLLQAERQQRLQIAVSGHTQRRSATVDKAREQALEALDLGRLDNAGVELGTQAYVRITRGCNKFCSFCVVPYTRGPEAHRPADHVVEEVRRLVHAGVQEVTLLGQTINHYEHRDGHRTTRFADLLRRVHDEVPQLARLRFLTSYPRDFTDDALDAMAASPRICRYLHIPAQSGSNAVLKRMNRGYTVEDYLSLIERAKARMPDIRLAGDMIVGFSGETDDDHQQSLALLRQVGLRACYVFKYSPRSGTVAQRRLVDDVPAEIKRARNAEMLALQQQIALHEHRRRIGEVVQVLVEKQGDERAWPQSEGQAPLVDALASNDGGQTVATSGLVQLGARARPARSDAAEVRLIGRSPGDEIVAFNGLPNAIGRMVHVRIEHATSTVLFGRLASA